MCVDEEYLKKKAYVQNILAHNAMKTKKSKTEGS